MNEIQYLVQKLLKLKCRKFKKNNNWENYFIDLKSKFRYPNNEILNPSLYKKAQTRNLKINRFCKCRSPFVLDFTMNL